MSIRVDKLNSHGQVVVSYRATLARRLPNGVVLHAGWKWPLRDLGYVILEPGDQFTEYFYTDRWHNIFAIRSRETGRLKGWYCNVARPASISESVVAAEDLILDVWVAPDGRWQILDEDEFAADHTLDQPTREAALAALGVLLAQIAAREPPFDEEAELKA
jgi:predicted RNA-binding protein associated with RNAse of E/G family